MVEIGTHFGRSTRRLIDMQEVLGLSYHVECYDVIDRVQFFDRDREATLHLEDVTGRVSELLLNRYGEGVIFLDARPRRLIEDLVAAVRDDASGKWALVVHDCGRGLYNEAMGEIDDDAISSNTGVWERHVVAAAFDREPAGALHGARRNDHVLEVLETRHGLGIVVPVARSGSGHS